MNVCVLEYQQVQYIEGDRYRGYELFLLTSVALLTPVTKSHSRMQWSHPPLTTSASSLPHTTAVAGCVCPDRVRRGTLVVAEITSRAFLVLEGVSVSESISSVPEESGTGE